MKETNQYKASLAKIICPTCGQSLEGSSHVSVSEVNLAAVLHVTCKHCKSKNMVTFTAMGTGVIPILSDLTNSEVRKYSHASKITFVDVLNVHDKLDKVSICNLLQKKEQN